MSAKGTKLARLADENAGLRARVDELERQVEEQARQIASLGWCKSRAAFLDAQELRMQDRTRELAADLASALGEVQRLKAPIDAADALRNALCDPPNKKSGCITRARREKAAEINIAAEILEDKIAAYDRARGQL